MSCGKIRFSTENAQTAGQYIVKGVTVLTKLKNFFYRASNILIDAVAGAATETIQDKMGEQMQKSVEQKHMKTVKKKSVGNKGSRRK